MAKAKQRKQSNSGKGQTKANKERQAAIQRMLMTLIITFIFFFGFLQLGLFGITVYNVMRFLTGSLAYLVMTATLIYLYAFKWIDRRDGLLGGFIMVMVGLLIAWHAYLFGQTTMAKQEVLSASARLLTSELLAAKVSQFAGGGMIGALLYKPVAFLFTNGGAYLIGALFIGLGIFMMLPWDLNALIDFSKASYQSYAAKRQVRKEERFIQKEEKRLAAEEARAAEAERLTLEQAQAEAEAERVTLQEEAQFQATNPEANRDDDQVGQSDQVYYDPETGEVYHPDQDGASEKSLDDWVAPTIVSYDSPEEDLGWDQESQDAIPDYEEIFESDQEPDWDQDDQEMEEDLEELDDLQMTFTPKPAPIYRLPTIDLFAPDKPKNQSKEKDLVRKNISVLEDTFKSFGISVKVERAEIGPSVTKYEVKPAVGVRVNRISNLADDLALALAAKDVRIEAPIPGKSLVGIEVPNAEIATVSFRELWEQSQTKAENLLEIPLGKAVNGNARSFDLTRMPHLLVAGSTGSGKSVAVNGIISSILMKARPDQVKFLMVDPKMVELSVYNDIPHLLIPVVTNPRKASKALQKVVDEMENRYERFSRFGVRNIAGYNAKVESWNSQSDQKEVPLPLIVVIVDELADLMMVASKEVEDAIIRLGQKARAAGIHMILATQRPSVDVISGLIKANVPSRVAFAVSSGTDSRTILDENGAEKLLGRGDMLFKPIDENHPVRLQGSFISDDDVERIVTFIKDQAEADYDETFDPGEVTEGDNGFSGNGGADEGDPLFEEAKALVLETQKASASMIQRRLSVGFNRATRLMEELEEAGVIGPAEGTKPRKVLMTQ